MTPKEIAFTDQATMEARREISILKRAIDIGESQTDSFQNVANFVALCIHRYTPEVMATLLVLALQDFTLIDANGLYRCDECMGGNHEDCQDGNRVSSVPFACFCASMRHSVYTLESPE